MGRTVYKYGFVLFIKLYFIFFPCDKQKKYEIIILCRGGDATD